MTTMTQATYGVRGLSCWRCMISAVEAVRALPGVHTVGMDLEPHGESLLTLAPAGAVTSAQVQATLDRSGFELTRRRRRPRPSRLRHALTTVPVDDGREILTEA